VFALILGQVFPLVPGATHAAHAGSSCLLSLTGIGFCLAGRLG